MKGSTFFSFASFIPAPQTTAIIESLLCEEAESEHPVVVNLSSDMHIRIRDGRALRDDAAGRYGNIAATSGVPVLNAMEAVEFFEAAAKPKNAAYTEGRSFIVVSKDPSVSETLRIFDSLCFLIPADSASIAFIFKTVHKMKATGNLVPIRVLIAGEKSIEKAAAFYVDLASEISEVGDGKAELSFGGNIFLDPEEYELAGAFGIPMLKAFPGGTFAGQIKNAAKKIFASDFADQQLEHPDRERLFLQHLQNR